MKISKRNAVLTISVILLILLQERFIYMTNMNLVMFISIAGLIYLLLHVNNLLSPNYIFSKFIAFFLFIQFYGIFIAKIFYGQSIVIGIVGAHYIFIYSLYFYFAKKFRNGNIDCTIKLVKNILIFAGTFIAILLIIQSFIYPFVIFNLTYGMRNGLRIQGCSIVQYSFVISICDILFEFKKKKLFSLIVMGYTLVFIEQSRNVILIFSIIIFFTVYKKLYDKNKKLFCLAILFIPLVIFIGWNYGLKEILLEVVSESQNIKGTSGMRVLELKYYFNMLKKSHFLGIGVLGDRFHLRDLIYGTNKGFYLEDIGVSAFIFKTGILGLIWTILYIFKLNKLVKKTDGWVKYLTLFLVLKTIMSMFFSYSFIFDAKDGLIYLIIILSIIDANIHKKERMI